MTWLFNSGLFAVAECDERTRARTHAHSRTQCAFRLVKDTHERRKKTRKAIKSSAKEDKNQHQQMPKRIKDNDERHKKNAK